MIALVEELLTNLLRLLLGLVALKLIYKDL
jgi:hypothetical protein